MCSTKYFTIHTITRCIDELNNSVSSYSSNVERINVLDTMNDPLIKLVSIE